MSTRLTFSRCRQMRWYSTKEKMKVIDTIDEQISNAEIKHRQHPGIMKPRKVDQPSWLLPSLKTIIKDETLSAKQLYEAGNKVELHLRGRHPPLEGKDYKIILKKVQSRLQTPEQEKTDIVLNKEDVQENKKALKLYKELAYNWSPILYDKLTSLSYLVNRSVPEYSVLYKIFTEIKDKDNNFVPKTLFDFGSGVGTVMWAASQFWFKSLREYVCIDISSNMNELSEYLAKRANPQISTNQIFYKQFLPASSTPTYDIVVSAYSLMELPNQKSRMEVIAKLWYKTEHYLIIVEQGTRAGFDLVNEARDFVLNYTKNKSGVHIVSPCPHELKCPRFTADDTPCNFEIVYQTLPIFGTSAYKRERYSYVVLKKGERPKEDPQWPRILRPVLKRSKHVICRMCVASGKLEEQIFTAWKNGKNTYRCARSSKWGDCLPFKIEEASDTEKSE
ncbi:ribosome assembly protein METTL17, mitochondrial [Calliopsis andreniformis]|uniref:ribosome assembly protein METTL17, mitochondrial n=1 Tax=Calliopsis andreniformis TaxID=337506 RepID=UPI003FCDCDD7